MIPGPVPTEPVIAEHDVTVYQGDVRAVLAQLPAESANCVVTSPPYYGLRDYGIEPSEWPAVEYAPMLGLPAVHERPDSRDRPTGVQRHRAHQRSPRSARPLQGAWPVTGQPDETRSDDEIRRETVALARTERPTPGEIGRLQSHALLLLADRARLVEENAELRAKLELPCGSCHPCNNWSDETWRRAGRKPPHVHEWDAARAEVTRLRQAVERIREAADGVIVTRQGGDFDSVSHVKLLRLIDAIIAAGGA